MHQLDHLSTHFCLEFYSSFKKSVLPKLKSGTILHSPLFGHVGLLPPWVVADLYTVCVCVYCKCVYGVVRSVFIGVDECVCVCVLGG